MELVTQTGGKNKAHAAISNSAKLLAGYMAATGISEAKTIADNLGIPLRTVQRLKLEVATASATRGASESAKHATRGVSECANSATRGVFQSEKAPNTPPVALRARVLDNTSLTSLVVRPVDSKTPLPPAKSKRPSPSEALEAFEAYNAMALRCGLAQAAKLTPDRQKRIIARLKDYGLDGWMTALTNIEHSAFLTGKNDRDWRANLDFLLQAASFSKVHDGGYGNGRKVALARPTGPVEPIEVMHARMKAKADKLLADALQGVSL
jgi:hypothetical protein